ncbi:MAG: hypothetical protein CDV28_1717 [Candidatus Electronema aureum]|uniref:Uncharacterized protein n=1 Tax=Candidatus Electronema aureum TaxID=2005002 RepID=A0A521FY38_9BACT|nr:MAG: hypothetical protein CDV28_1717 [Candidatus Electronema aureum]
MPTREDVKTKVIQLLSIVSSMDIGKIKEESHLKSDLLLASAMIKALAGPYTAISKGFGGSMITITEAGKVDTVKSVIDLIWGKIPPSNKQ